MPARGSPFQTLWAPSWLVLAVFPPLDPCAMLRLVGPGQSSTWLLPILWDSSFRKHSGCPVTCALMLWPQGHPHTKTPCVFSGCPSLCPQPPPPLPSPALATVLLPWLLLEAQGTARLWSASASDPSLSHSGSSSHSGAWIQDVIFRGAAPAVPGGPLLQAGSQADCPLCDRVLVCPARPAAPQHRGRRQPFWPSLPP